SILSQSRNFKTVLQVEAGIYHHKPARKTGGCLFPPAVVVEINKRRFNRMNFVQKPPDSLPSYPSMQFLTIGPHQ
ncbi:MAG: hypothetical protein ACYCXH_10845, partial [Bellilinea sp.]